MQTEAKGLPTNAYTTLTPGHPYAPVVPAGKFHCIKLHYHEKRGDEVIDEDAWYAEGVGQVKYDGGQYVKELKTYQIK